MGDLRLHFLRRWFLWVSLIHLKVNHNWAF